MTRERIVGAAVTCFVLAFAGLVGGLVFDRERWPAWPLVNGVAGLVAGALLAPAVADGRPLTNVAFAIAAPVIAVFAVAAVPTSSRPEREIGILVLTWVGGGVAGARLLQRRFATIRPANDSRSAGEVARDRKFARAWTEAVIVVVALPIIYFVLLLTGGCQMCP